MKKILHTLIGSFPAPIKILFLLIPTCLWADCCVRPGLLSFGMGTFDTLRRDERMLQFQVEYKWKGSWHGLQPFAGMMITTKASLYFCFGGCYDFYLGKYLVLTPSFAPGLYFKNKGKDLGLPLEFRSSISLAIEFCQCQRLGVQFYHISNGSLGHKNPGEESLVVYYSFVMF